MHLIKRINIVVVKMAPIGTGTRVAILVSGVQVANAQVLWARRRCAEKDNLR